ncbi:MAG: AEC family transporter [Clostridia bacterium]|nr:AEC family transporter [Clostridia bacterium]
MFLQNVLIASEQVAILYILVAVGAIADKAGIYTEKVAKSCTDLLFYIITPAVIIESFLSLEYNAETAKSLFIAMGCGFILHIVSAAISALVFNRCPADRRCIYKYSCAYGNCGYMALPLAGAVLGNEGVFYCSAVIISFQVFSFTHGIYTITKGKEGEKIKFDFKKLILNPGVISVIIGLPLFLLSVQLPEIIAKPMSYIASLNTPVAMLIFGTYIANTNFKSIFKDWRIFAVSLVKLIILPLLLISAFRLAGITGSLLVALSISAGAPTANNTVMFAAKYDRNTGLASQTVAVVSFISIITLPVMIALAQAVG